MNSESDMQLFLLIAQKGSLSGAALELGVTPSAVSRRLARIEDRLGVRLLNRTTRRISLTSEGEAYIHASRDIIGQIERMEHAIALSREEPRGLLRINCSFQFGREHIGPVISNFVRAYPEVEVRLVLSDTPANLVEEGYDLSIRFGLPPSSNLIARLLLRNRRLLIAAPSYLEKHGEPRQLADLTYHTCIVLRQESDAYDVWRFEGQDSVRVAGGLSTNDGEIAVNWVLDGHGIMLRSEWDMAHHINAGKLKILLPNAVQQAHIYAVYPERHNLSAKVTTFINFLQDNLQKKAGHLRLSEGD